jgi:large subunit ribosomal protein L3
MAQMLMGRKRGMTQRFDETGNVIACTVIEVEPNVVVQVKTVERDGYAAIQLGFEEVRTADERTLARRVGKPLMGHFARSTLAPRRFLMEARVARPEAYAVGQPVTVECFSVGALLDVTATSKGKGFQGVIPLHHMRGGPAAHGSGFHRHGGSTGMRSSPGRVLPGTKRPSRMGNRRRTMQNLRVLAIDPQRNLIVVAGAVPGHKGAMVVLNASIKSRRDQMEHRGGDKSK